MISQRRRDGATSCVCLPTRGILLEPYQRVIQPDVQILVQYQQIQTRKSSVALSAPNCRNMPGRCRTHVIVTIMKTIISDLQMIFRCVDEILRMQTGGFNVINVILELRSGIESGCTSVSLTHLYVCSSDAAYATETQASTPSVP